MNHLIVLSVGPVQEFIAAARRTRDLWFGSTLLSDISSAAAKAMQNSGAKLIFPSEVNPHISVANIILAEFEATNPSECLEKGKAAAREAWKKVAGKALDKANGLIVNERWNRQVDDVLEMYGCWVPVTTEGYASARKNLMRLLDARKNMRNFAPASGKDEGIPKSSLDGLRETVLIDNAAKIVEKKDLGRWRALRLKTGEQLDIIGVVKRLGERQSFPSVSRVSADPWIRGVSANQKCARGWAEFKTACENLAQIDKLARVNSPIFGYEGGAIYAGRHAELTEETDADLTELKISLSSLQKIHGEPDPYLAILVADGDKIGEALGTSLKAEDHRAFSSKLAAFATDAAKIVEATYNGVSVYTGGDDVLAFLPVDKAIDCAHALQERFRKVHPGVTLSVGLAIGHCLENLEDLLNWGRTAEKHAKNKKSDEPGDHRNGLAVHLNKRGGGPVLYRDNWGNNPKELLLGFADDLRVGRLPRKFASDLAAIAARYSAWPTSNADQIKLLKEALVADATYRFGRKKPELSKDEVEACREKILELLNGVKSHHDIKRIADAMAIGYHIQKSLEQAEPTQ